MKTNYDDSNAQEICSMEICGTRYTAAQTPEGKYFIATGEIVKKNIATLEKAMRILDEIERIALKKAKKKLFYDGLDFCSQNELNLTK